MELKDKKGFTVLEMIAVVSMITILMVLFFWYTQGNFLTSKNTLIENWVTTLNAQVELYKIHNLEAGRAVELNGKTMKEVIQQLSDPVPGEDRVVIFKENLAQNQYISSIGWDAVEQKFYRKL